MIQFLYRLLRLFIGSDSGSELPATVEAHEPLTRFIFSSEHFAHTKGIVKPKAFLPDGDGETSVFRVSSLGAEQIWEIGNKVRNEKAKARGSVLTNMVRRIGLQVNGAPEEHPRHAIIVGWPREKHAKLMLAVELSKKASLHVQSQS
jgi:hypothetical protein